MCVQQTIDIEERQKDRHRDTKREGENTRRHQETERGEKTQRGNETQRRERQRKERETHTEEGWRKETETDREERQRRENQTEPEPLAQFTGQFRDPQLSVYSLWTLVMPLSSVPPPFASHRSTLGPQEAGTVRLVVGDGLGEGREKGIQDGTP